jgi:hypothetical protein
VSELTSKFLLIIVVVAGFLGWHWYQERLLWDAARAHYVEQLKNNDERFYRAVEACEAEARKKDFSLGKGEWNPHRIWLKRGFNLDPDLRSMAWERDYQFYVVLMKTDPSMPSQLSAYLMCEYNVDREEVEDVYEPEPSFRRPWHTSSWAITT